MFNTLLLIIDDVVESSTISNQDCLISDFLFAIIIKDQLNCLLGFQIVLECKKRFIVDDDLTARYNNIRPMLTLVNNPG